MTQANRGNSAYALHIFVAFLSAKNYLLFFFNTQFERCEANLSCERHLSILVIENPNRESDFCNFFCFSLGRLLNRSVFVPKGLPVATGSIVIGFVAIKSVAIRSVTLRSVALQSVSLQPVAVQSLATLWILSHTAFLYKDC